MSPVWKSVKIKNLDHEASGGVEGGQCIHIKLSKKQETSCFRDLRLHAQAPARRAVLAFPQEGFKGRTVLFSRSTGETWAVGASSPGVSAVRQFRLWVSVASGAPAKRN